MSTVSSSRKTSSSERRNSKEEVSVSANRRSRTQSRNERKRVSVALLQLHKQLYLSVRPTTLLILLLLIVDIIFGRRVQICPSRDDNVLSCCDRNLRRLSSRKAKSKTLPWIRRSQTMAAPSPVSGENVCFLSRNCSVYLIKHCVVFSVVHKRSLFLPP